MTKFSPSKPLFLFFLLLIFVQPVIATHYMGGEITWECTPQGNFRFTMKLYRECYTSNGNQAANFYVTETMNTTAPGFPAITMSRISINDISPKCGCPGGIQITCPGMATGAANMGAIEEHVYTSDAIYPNGVPLIGVPPAIGWTFQNSSCCRNSSTNIPGQPGWWIRSVMYPYNNTSVNTCFDNAPVFTERPATVLCTGQPILFHQFAMDPDHDSLSFEWTQPFSGSNTPITNYSSGYSFNSPLPGPIHHPNNVSAWIHPANGVVQFTSYTSGAFVMAIKVTSFHNGIRTAEIIREIQMVLKPCGTNNPPVLLFTSNLTTIAPGHLHISVPVGDSVSFGLILNDIDTCPGTLQFNNIYLKASGEIFGPPLNPAGCVSGPCASLNPSPTFSAPLIMQGTLGTNFGWRTNIAHLDHSNGLLKSKTHTLFFEFGDNACPVPHISSLIITIEVTFPFSMQPTEILCARVIPNGDVQLNWEPNAMPGYAFNKYEIMSATNPQGPYSVVSSIANLTASTFTHTGAGANIQPRHYYINTELHTPVALSIPSNANFTPIFLTVTPQTAATTRVILTWNHTNPASPTGAPRLYEVFRDDGNGIWQLIGHTYFTTYNDYMPFLNQTVRYRIETPLTDSSGTILLCRSISNVVPVFLSALEDPANQAKSPIIFPNPNHGTFMLDPGDLQGDATIRILSSDGSLVHQLNATLVPNQPCTIAIPGLAEGIYWVHIITGRGEYSLRMKNEE